MTAEWVGWEPGGCGVSHWAGVVTRPDMLPRAMLLRTGVLLGVPRPPGTAPRDRGVPGSGSQISAPNVHVDSARVLRYLLCAGH